jgi:hypothetical protein
MFEGSTRILPVSVASYEAASLVDDSEVKITDQNQHTYLMLSIRRLLLLGIELVSVVKAYYTR